MVRDAKHYLITPFITRPRSRLGIFLTTRDSCRYFTNHDISPYPIQSNALPFQFHSQMDAYKSRTMTPIHLLYVSSLSTPHTHTSLLFFQLVHNRSSPLRNCNLSNFIDRSNGNGGSGGGLKFDWFEWEVFGRRVKLRYHLVSGTDFFVTGEEVKSTFHRNW